VRKPFYGFNDAPEEWRKRLDRELKALGTKALKFDKCAYKFHEELDGIGWTLTGIVLVHVDDMLILTHPRSVVFRQKVLDLRKIFKFGSWKKNAGTFLGLKLQKLANGVIRYGNDEFCDDIKPVHVRKNQGKDEAATESQVGQMRAALGSLQWAAGHWRPDLSCQVSLCQQAFPNPTAGDVARCNVAIRRSKQDAKFAIQLSPIPKNRVTLYGHCDAALHNASRKGSQAGFLVAAGDQSINEGVEGAWGLLGWKSGRLRRVVASSLSA
jgi:hypothetical protein